MKTSHKILLIISGILIALFVTGLMILRKDLDSLPKPDQMSEEVTMQPFHKVKISDHWDVTVTQGREYSVKLLYDDKNKVVKPSLYTRDSTLIIGIDTLGLNLAESTKARIQVIAPKIRSFDVGDSSKLRLKGLSMDSVSIQLGYASALISEENTFEYLSFESLGSSFLEYIANP